MSSGNVSPLGLSSSSFLRRNVKRDWSLFLLFCKTFVKRKRSEVHCRNTRACNNFVVPRCRLSMGQRAFYFRGPREWNGLADNIKNIKEVDSFKRTLFNNMFYTK